MPAVHLIYAMSEQVAVDYADVYAALVNVDQVVLTPLSDTDVKIDSSAFESERDSLMALLCKYRDVFAKTLTELGCTDVLRVNIVEVEGSDPLRQRPYQALPTDRRTIARILDEWRSAGIITDST